MTEIVLRNILQKSLTSPSWQLLFCKLDVIYIIEGKILNLETFLGHNYKYILYFYNNSENYSLFSNDSHLFFSIDLKQNYLWPKLPLPRWGGGGGGSKNEKCSEWHGKPKKCIKKFSTKTPFAQVGGGGGAKNRKCSEWHGKPKKCIKVPLRLPHQT